MVNHKAQPKRQRLVKQFKQITWRGAAHEKSHESCLEKGDG